MKKVNAVALRACFTSFRTHLFGGFCCFLREKFLPGDSLPANFCLETSENPLENLRTSRYETGSKKILQVFIAKSNGI